MTAEDKRQDGKKPALKVGRPATYGPNHATGEAIAAAALELFSRSGVAAGSNTQLG